MPVEPFSIPRDHVSGVRIAGGKPSFALAVSSVSSDGTDLSVLPAGTDRSGTAQTTSGQIIAANPARRGLDIQNIGANNIGINEFGGTAAIGTPGTYTVAPNGSFRVKTNRAVTAIAATAATAFTATEW